MLLVGDNNMGIRTSRTAPLCASLVIAALALLTTGCRRKASDEMDFGTVKNSVYHNNYLGLSMTLPSGWSVQDQKSQQRLINAGGALVAGDDKTLKSLLKASDLQNVNLFAVFKYPLGSPVTLNPSIMGVAERVRQLPGIQQGRDYLFHAKKLLEAGQLQISFPKEIYAERLGGVDFDIMEMEVSILGSTVKERYYATVRKGYALSLVVVYEEGDEALQRKALDSIRFE
jgi:hypothetical protein